MTCARCPAPIVQPPTGRPRKFCSDACKVAAYRHRRRLLAPFIAAGLLEQNGHGLRVTDPDVSLAFDMRLGDPLPGYLHVLRENGLDMLGDPLDGAALSLGLRTLADERDVVGFKLAPGPQLKAAA